MHSHKSCLGCQHENLKFCGCCRVPYCVDCGKEWQERTYWYNYPFYNTGLQQLQLSQSENTNTLKDGHEVITVSSCKHGA